MPDTETILLGIGTSLAATALWESSKWAWNHREQIADKLLRSTPPIQTILAGFYPSEEQSFGATVVQLKGVPSDELVGSLTASSSATGTLTVGSERQVLYNVEASTLPDRLLDEGLELLSWYLRQR